MTPGRQHPCREPDGAALRGPTGDLAGHQFGGVLLPPHGLGRGDRGTHHGTDHEALEHAAHRENEIRRQRGAGVALAQARLAAPASGSPAR